MAKEDQDRWNEKHARGHGAGSPSPFLQRIFSEYASRLGPGKALDIATGKGRNAIFLAERGFGVDALDISGVALEEARRLAGEKGLSVAWKQADLDTLELPRETYDLILNFNFLQRSLVPRIKGALKLGGHVIFEAYLIDQRALGHPRNPDYLLAHNELLDLFRDFRVLSYREGRFLEGGKEAYRAGLFGQKAR